MADITLLLKEFCEEGYLRASGIGKGTKYSLNVASNISSEEIDADADGEDSDLAAEYDENVASKVSRNVASNVWNKNVGAYLFDKIHISKWLMGTVQLH